MVNVLLIGSGGREHALALALSRSPILKKLFCAPGNPGIAAHAECVVVDCADHQKVIDFCRLMKIDFVVIGPEIPLVAGLVDDLDKAGIKAFGPRKNAAQLEGSKGYTKALCVEVNIPTAAYKSFGEQSEALAYIAERGAPIVVKADGLAAGKGVTVAMTVEDANSAIASCFETAGASVVVEDYLEGEEVSFFVMTDGVTALPLSSAQDHKRVGEHDTGPNTGGMGAYSPAPIFTSAVQDEVMARIILPTIEGMARRGVPYKGVLYAGLMLTKTGPQLIEYNCRFGDPETQVVIPRLESDLLKLLLACTEGRLADAKAAFSNTHAITVVYAANGYPGPVEKGSVIEDVKNAGVLENVIVTHAGTAMKDGKLVANGGRVLNITATGDTLKAAQQMAYQAIAQINWPQGFYRRDIGWRALRA